MLLHSSSALSTMRRSPVRRARLEAKRSRAVQKVSHGPRWLRLGMVLGLVLAVSACATPPSDPVARAEFDKTNDPLEPMNRKIFAFNQVVDHALLRPAAKTYVTVVPDDARHAIHNVLDNMKEPTLFFNNL